MSTLTLFVLILGVFLPAALAHHDECPKSGKNEVDWTKEEAGGQWYYCQTSLKGRKQDNCYVSLTDKKDESMDVTVYMTTIGTNKKEDETFEMKHIADGKYSYTGLKTFGVNLAVPPSRDCVAYWKCTEKDVEWNGAKSHPAYFMFLCNAPEKCMKLDQYTGDQKTAIDEAIKLYPELNGQIEDIDQQSCKKTYPDKYIAA